MEINTTLSIGSTGPLRRLRPANGQRTGNENGSGGERSGVGNSNGRPIVVLEGDHLKLTCAASGEPRPLITWSRGDGDAFPDGAWRSQ